jgi:hypothetical protein
MKELLGLLLEAIKLPFKVLKIIIEAVIQEWEVYKKHI